MSNYPIFSVMGLEIEYMLVNKSSLNVEPKSDLLLRELANEQVNEVVLGDIAVSNELVMHVIELKNNGPKPPSATMGNAFSEAIQTLKPLLDKYDLTLLPSGAHPWMDPAVETKRWPHGDKSIYQKYDEIFNCQGHGWANLQSMHVNLPFSNDEEFCQLHNTVRLLLPLLPALAASTPILNSTPTGFLDARLDFYGKNQQKIPSICNGVIPEFMPSRAQYESDILTPMYTDISRYDPEGILQYEWLNSRGAIPKFNYMALEIRIIDSQECVDADMAIAKGIYHILKRWHQTGSTLFQEQICANAPLKRIFDQSLVQGFATTIDDKLYLEQLHLPTTRTLTLRNIWSLLIEQISHELDQPTQRIFEYLLSQGNLSERILRACSGDFSREKLSQVYHRLNHCLFTNQQL